MTAVDLRPYVDLTPMDRGPAELMERAVLDLQARLGAKVEPGSVEAVLLEAMALQVSEVIYALNRVPPGVLEVLLRLHRIERRTGGPAKANATVTMTDNLGHTVPSGTRFRLAGADELVTTDAALTVNPGATAGNVAVTASKRGSFLNSTPVGTRLVLVDSVLFVETAALATAMAGGSDPEDQATFLGRAVTELGRRKDTLVVAEDFQTKALDNQLVERARAVDDTRGDTGAADTGHVSVAVLGFGGAALSSSQRADLEATLESAALGSLNVWVIDAGVESVSVEVTVRRLAGFTDAEVITNVSAVLDAYLSPSTWGWSATVRRNELIARIDGAAGVDYVDTLTTPAADVALTAWPPPLADLGGVIVTVLPPL